MKLCRGRDDATMRRARGAGRRVDAEATGRGAALESATRRGEGHGHGHGVGRDASSDLRDA